MQNQFRLRQIIKTINFIRLITDITGGILEMFVNFRTDAIAQNGKLRLVHPVFDFPTTLCADDFDINATLLNADTGTFQISGNASFEDKQFCCDVKITNDDQTQHEQARIRAKSSLSDFAAKHRQQCKSRSRASAQKEKPTPPAERRSRLQSR